MMNVAVYKMHLSAPVPAKNAWWHHGGRFRESENTHPDFAYNNVPRAQAWWGVRSIG